MRYEEPGKARFSLERTSDGTEIIIPARKNWFVIAFLTFWLCGWTVGGGAAMVALASQFNLFILFWLGGWVLGWIFASGTLAWQLAGREVIAIRGGDLVAGWRVLGLSHTKLYRGIDVRNLAANDVPSWPFNVGSLNATPFFPSQMGAVRFAYGARTISLAQGVDGEEAAAIVAELKRRLPIAASSVV